jgi:hypothetical protein
MRWYRGEPIGGLPGFALPIAVSVEDFLYVVPSSENVQGHESIYLMIVERRSPLQNPEGSFFRLSSQGKT